MGILCRRIPAQDLDRMLRILQHSKMGITIHQWWCFLRSKCDLVERLIRQLRAYKVLLS